MLSLLERRLGHYAQRGARKRRRVRGFRFPECDEGRGAVFGIRPYSPVYAR